MAITGVRVMKKAELIEQLTFLQQKYEHLKFNYKRRGEINAELNIKNQYLIAENNDLKAMMCEKFEITPDILALNIKLYNRERQVKTKQCIIKHLKRGEQ
jgi:hypothetical protein